MVSVGIGQGFNAYTPLQMANATAILAADGKVFKPHLVQEITQAGSGKVRLVEPRPVRTLAFRPELYEHVKDGMVAVMRPGGTAARLAAGLTYTMAGKTVPPRWYRSSKAPSTTRRRWQNSTAIIRGLLLLLR